MSVKRYNVMSYSLDVDGNSGPFVKYEDYAALEARCAEMAAENAGLKAGITYFAYSPDYGFDYFKDKQSAIDTAQGEIDAYRDDADGEDGWSDDVQRVSWGVVVQQAQGFDAQGLHTSNSRYTYQTCNFRLVDAVKTPATDAFLAEVRASAVDEVCLKISNSIPNCYQDELVGLDMAATICGDFASELRKGVQS